MINKIDGPSSGILQNVALNINDPSLCSNYTKNGYAMNWIQQICSNAPNKDACNGDSGGPLYVVKEGSSREQKFVLAGITSFGEGCGNPAFPGFIFFNIYFCPRIFKND